MVGLVFLTSGWNHLRDPAGRSKDIGLSKRITIFLGTVELAGSLGIILGVFAQLAAASLILIMLGAIQKKIFVWRTGFWGKSGTNGWSYEVMLVVMNLVIVTTGGGNLSLMKRFTQFIAAQSAAPPAAFLLLLTSFLPWRWSRP